MTSREILSALNYLSTMDGVYNFWWHNASHLYRLQALKDPIWNAEASHI